MNKNSAALNAFYHSFKSLKEQIKAFYNNQSLIHFTLSRHDIISHHIIKHFLNNVYYDSYILIKDVKQCISEEGIYYGIHFFNENHEEFYLKINHNDNEQVMEINKNPCELLKIINFNPKH